MSFFKNDKMVKKEEIKVETIPVEVVTEIDTRDLQISEQKALIAEATELFSKMLKGYPVNDKVKVWVEKAGREL